MLAFINLLIFIQIMYILSNFIQHLLPPSHQFNGIMMWAETACSSYAWSELSIILNILTAMRCWSVIRYFTEDVLILWFFNNIVLLFNCFIQEQDITKLEAKINCGQVEELIKQVYSFSATLYYCSLESTCW